MVRPGDRNDELRWSLRSIARNLPHCRVWLVGHSPRWVTGVESVPLLQRGTKWANSTANLRAACEQPGVSDPFVYFNDDMFVMLPLERVPVLHRGSVADVIAEYTDRGSRRYVEGMRTTAGLLARLGHVSPLSYELHVPLVVHKAQMIEALELGREIPVLHKRTLYGNLARIGGQASHDVKVCERRPDWSTEWPLLSTDDRSFAKGDVGRWVRSRFAQPGPYEKGD